jgi:uroporphyrinogen-III synthase
MPNQETLRKSLFALKGQDWLIFISPQAVQASITAISRVLPPFKQTMQFAAIGEGTAKMLQNAGYTAVVYPHHEWGSEGLLNMIEFQAVVNKKITLIQGEGGRDHLALTLSARGAIVTSFIAYQRVLPAISANRYVTMLKKRLIEVIICTSFEGVRNLKCLIGELGWPYLKNTPLVVVSERIKTLAYNLGLQTIFVARNASHQAIFEALKEQYDRTT